MLVEILKKYSVFIILIIGILFIFFSQKNPCDTPITYKIGTFDERFGISQKDFLQTINQSAEIWGKSLGKTVFTYDVRGDLTINLIYDNRQKITQTNASLHADAIKINQLADSVKQQYLNLENTHKALEKEYLGMFTLFEQHQRDYNSKVTYWNTHDGAPKNEYNQLLLDKESLSTEQALLENKRLEVNSLVEQINTFIHKYNLLINDANARIDTMNLSAGREFEEGLYDPNKNEINIYEFSTNKKLIRVIIHELGHALDLPHNDNPQSIMYALNQANTISLSKEDLAALELRCNAGYPFINIYNNLKGIFAPSQL